MTWIQTFAAWTPLPALELLDAVEANLFDDLDEILETAGAEDVGSRHLQVSENHAHAWPGMEGPRYVARLETRAIVLRHPNPFPELVLFPRLLRLENRIRPRLGAVLGRLRYWRALLRLRRLSRRTRS